jgi:hypothetical protein
MNHMIYVYLGILIVACGSVGAISFYAGLRAGKREERMIANNERTLRSMTAGVVSRSEMLRHDIARHNDEMGL